MRLRLIALNSSDKAESADHVICRYSIGLDQRDHERYGLIVGYLRYIVSLICGWFRASSRSEIPWCQYPESVPGRRSKFR